jgi:phospholipid transport system substrate-binding protein
MNRTIRNILMGAAAFTVMSVPVFAGPYDLRQTSSFSFIAVNAAAADQAAQDFIAKMGDRGINFLGDTSMSMEAKKKEFTKLLDESFDMSTIGRFTLGSNWKTATPAQQQEYQKLFRAMIIKVYSKRFSDYEGQKFEVRSSRKDNDKDTTVTSYIVPNSGPQVRVDWRVRKKGDSYKVIDISVEGVSMSQTQRSDFSSVIQRGGGDIEALLKHLRQQ